MVYKSSISKKQVFSIVNGKKQFKKNIYLRENLNNNIKFIRHLEINDKSRTLAGFTHNGKMSLKSIKTNGNKLSHKTKTVSKSNDLSKMIRTSLSFNNIRNKRSKSSKSKSKSKSSKRKSSKSKSSKSKSKSSKSKSSKSKSSKSKSSKRKSKSKSSKRKSKSKSSKRKSKKD
jgi:hypothetical protein